MSFRVSRWPQVPLGDVIASVKPGFASGERNSEGTIHFRMNNVDRSGNISWNTLTRVPADARKLAAYALEAGDVLFNQTNSRDLVGKTAFFQGHREPVVFSNHFLRLRPRPSKIEGAYLARYLQNLYLTGFFGAKCNAWVNQATYGKDDLLAQLIPLPPLAEQRRIAAILDKADAIRRKRQQALALADDFLRSAFLEMFGGFFANPMKWPMVPLGELIRRGPQNGLYKPSKDYGSGTPIVRIDSFYDGKIHGLSRLKKVRLSADEVATYLLDQDDILINRVNSRSHLGKCALVPQMSEPTIFESNMMRLSVDSARLHPVYLTRVLQSPFLNEQIQRRAKDAVNQASINQGDVTSFVIPLPPLADQQRFVDVDATIAASFPRRQHAHLEAEALFASLSQRAFRGDLLPDSVPA